MNGSPSGLFQHVQHFRLKDVVNRFDGDSRSALRHGKDVDTRDLLLALSSIR
jgi:hypothetical protein